MDNSDLFHLYKTVRDNLYLLEEEIAKRNIDWRHLAANGLIVRAVVSFRNKHNVTLKEAKDAVDSFRKQEGLM